MKRVRFIIITVLAVIAIASCKKDKNAPVITILGTNPAVAGQGLDYIDAGATAMDEEDGDITDKIVVTNGVNTADTGTYFVRYNVEDNAGNKATEVIRTVNVIYF
jgi:hypothetical protein